MSFVSVIVPNYNHAEFLSERIESILMQTYQHFELIILDDASTDHSRDIIERYRHHVRTSKIIYDETNSGSPYQQWRKGIQESRGNLIWIAESDDLAHPEFLSTAVAAFNNYKDLSLFYCDAINLQEEHPTRFKTFAESKNMFFGTDKWSKEYAIDGEDEINIALKYLCSVNNTSSALMKKEMLIKNINEISGYRYYGDWFAFINLASQGKIAYSPRALNHFRHHKESLLNKGPNIVKARKELFGILNTLLSLDFVNEKGKLVDYFTGQYLGIGFVSGDLKEKTNIFRSYFDQKPMLALKVMLISLRHKLTGKKYKPLF